MFMSNLTVQVKVMHVVSEGLEAFGGAGYLEDTGIPTIFRDSQVQLTLCSFDYFSFSYA